jgi:hypothetical protein
MKIQSLHKVFTLISVYAKPEGHNLSNSGLHMQEAAMPHCIYYILLEAVLKHVLHIVCSICIQICV